MKTTGIRTMLLVRLAGLLLWHPGSAGTPSAGTLAAGTPGRTHAARAGSVDPRERGDVPGWVMITLMSAVLVAALLALAGPALEGLFNQAMQKVGQ